MPKKKIANIDVHLPDDIKIIECATDVPKEIATFSGVLGEHGPTMKGRKVHGKKPYPQ